MNLEVINANYAYKQGENLYLEDINFTLNKGEILTILGPNGAGKTSLLKAITGLNKWSKGASLFNGKKVSEYEKNDFWKQVAFIAPAKKTNFSFSLFDYVLMGRAVFVNSLKQPSKQDKIEAQEALEKVGIGHLKDKLTNEVSSGEMQLASLAQALTSKPKIFFMDEPESHLDINKQVHLLKTIKNLVKENNLSCIVNTHFPNHAFYLADKVLMTAKGKKALIGNASDILNTQNMQEYFNVELTHICHYQNNCTLQTFIPNELISENIIFKG